MTDEQWLGLIGIILLAGWSLAFFAFGVVYADWKRAKQWKDYTDERIERVMGRDGA